MKISPNVLESIKERCSIEETISKYVALKPNGNRATGLCPFHSEKTPSFTVFSDTQSFYCFGCGAGGDVVTFIMRTENLEYPEAVKLLADRAGIHIEQNKEEEKMLRLRSRVYAMNKEAARFFHECLYSESGAAGMAYIKKRGLKKSTVTRFGIGFAPNSWDALTKHLISKGYTEDELVAAFLAGRGKGGRCYDMFRNRVIFPIIDITGKVVAFGGRRVDDSDPRKYINSSNTPVYRKGQTVFALNFAKGADKLILTEGYMDVISLHEAGFTGAVASCGTAITADQCRLLSRYFNEVTIAYDTDGAGRAAVEKAIELFKPTGIAINILKYDGEKDPDEFIRKRGAAAFGELLYGSGNYIDYRLSVVRKENPIDTADGKVKYLNAAVSLVAQEDSELKREVYAARIAEETSVDKRTVINEINKLRKQRGNRERKKEITLANRKLSGADDKINPEKKNNLRGANAEEELVRILFAYPTAYEYIKNAITDSQFVTEFNRRIFCSVIGVVEEGRKCELSDLNADFNPNEMGAVARIMLNAEKEPFSPDALKKVIEIIIEEKGKLSSADVKDMDAADIQNYIINSLKSKKKPGSTGMKGKMEL